MFNIQCSIFKLKGKKHFCFACAFGKSLSTFGMTGERFKKKLKHFRPTINHHRQTKTPSIVNSILKWVGVNVQAVAGPGKQFVVGYMVVVIAV